MTVWPADIIRIAWQNLRLSVHVCPTGRQLAIQRPKRLWLPCRFHQHFAFLLSACVCLPARRQHLLLLCLACIRSFFPALGCSQVGIVFFLFLFPLDFIFEKSLRTFCFQFERSACGRDVVSRQQL